MSAVSSTFGTHYPVHSEECAISLSLKMCRSSPGSLVISFRSGISVRPMHLFGRTTAIMITSADSPGKGSGTPNQLLGVGLHTMAISGLSRVRTELSQLLIIPSLAPHPVQANGESPRHRYLGDLPSPPHGQMKVLTAPFRQAAPLTAQWASPCAWEPWHPPYLGSQRYRLRRPTE